MIALLFKPAFIRQLHKLEKGLLEEALEKMEMLKNEKNHEILKVHNLHGKYSGCFSFSVNYKTRIVFEYESGSAVALLAIGDHDVYK